MSRQSLAAALLVSAAFAVPLQAQTHLPHRGAPAGAAVAARLAVLPAELSLAEGDLRVVNLHKLQGEALLGAAGQSSDSVVARLVRTVYAPYARFWNGYLGDEAAFRKWSATLLDPGHPIHARIGPLLDAGLDRRFVEGVAWIDSATGRRPAGTWYIVFGPGWTDMGGLTDIGMVADFSKMEPDSVAIAAILPHELTHQVQSGSPARANDPDAGTVLDRVVGEGFASYVSWVHGAGLRTRAAALMYTDAEWEWALAHERELMAAVQPLLGSRERADADLIASRSSHLIAGAPGAAGYFLGLRIVDAYVARHGRDSWKDLYDLPAGVVLRRSGYLDER